MHPSSESGKQEQRLQAGGSGQADKGAHSGSQHGKGHSDQHRSAQAEPANFAAELNSQQNDAKQTVSRATDAVLATFAFLALRHKKVLSTVFLMLALLVISLIWIYLPPEGWTAQRGWQLLIVAEVSLALQLLLIIYVSAEARWAPAG